MAEGLIGSEILRIATDIRAMLAGGRRICNLTVGDFSPTEFRVPVFFEEAIQEALKNGETNYPPSDGMLSLRTTVLSFYAQRLGLDYDLPSVLITGGSRPGIYATYTAVVDHGDAVVYPVPSWNNNHYCHLTGAVGRPVVCGPGDDFLPTAALLRDALRGARLLAVNSPLNPTGTAFSKDVLEGICDLVLEENARRGPSDRPLYFLYDQVYWMLTYGSTVHYNPVSLRPGLKPYTIFVDGISKPFAATGVRVGWVVGPSDIVQKMASIVGHVGAWAPRAEQVATAKLLDSPAVIAMYHTQMKAGIETRLERLFEAINEMKREGLPVDAIAPMGAIYLSARFALNGCTTPDGILLSTNEEIRQYLLHEAGIAVVPFQAFGSTEETGWFRLSVGAVSVRDIDDMLPKLREALMVLRR
jgi:aspartate aminotransferase